MTSKKLLVPLAFSLLAGSVLSASASEEIVIGCSTAMTGPLMILGTSAHLGAKIYFDRLNKSGGINAKHIDYMVLDDSYQPEKTIENIKALASDGRVVGVLSDLGTANALAVLPFVQKSNLPFLFPIAGSDRLRLPVDKNIFLLLAGSENESNTLLRYAHNTLKINEIGVLSQSDGMGQGYRNGALRSLHDMELKPTVDEQYDRKTRQTEAALKKFLEVRPKAIYFGGTSDAILPFVEKLAAQDYHPTLLFSSGVGTMQVLKSSIMKSNFAGVYATENVPLAILQDVPLTKSLMEDLKAAGTNLEKIELQYVLEGYFSANVVATALKNIPGAVTRESLVNALAALGPINVGGVPVALSVTNHLLFENVRIYNLLAGPREVFTK